MTKKSFFLRLYLSAMMVSLASITASAQVTIGSSNPPSSFSLLYLDAAAENQRKGLHNARLTTAQRDALVTPDSIQTVQDLAVGLLLFNTDNNCLEFWNGSRWISLCENALFDPCAGDFLKSFNNIFQCDLNPTIDSLTARIRAAGSRGDIRWYENEKGGAPLSGDTELQQGGYYLGGCADGTRILVPVIIQGCYTGIYSWFDLAKIGAVGGYPLDGHFILMNNLDKDSDGYPGHPSGTAIFQNAGVTGGYTGWDAEGWIRIGGYEDAKTVGADPATGMPILIGGFTGTFDGNGNTISDLWIQRPKNILQGLFGVINGGTVKNLSVGTAAGDSILGTTAGGIVGMNLGGTILNSNFTGIANGSNVVSGIAGTNWDGIISNSSNAGTVSGNNVVGGIVGTNLEGTISNCYNTGNVSGGNAVGGIVGTISGGTISNSYNTGSVIGLEYVGGIVGINSVVYAGRIAGIIKNCYNIGSVSGNDGVGGVVGVNIGMIENSYNTGFVSGNVDVGSIVGNNGGSTNVATATVSNSYALNCSVTGNTNVGRIAGRSSGILTNNFALDVMTGNFGSTTGAGTVNGADITPGDATGNVVNSMRNIWSTYADVWDFRSAGDLPILLNVGGAQNPEIEECPPTAIAPDDTPRPLRTNGFVTSFVRVVYDFQTQELAAYVTGGTAVTSWQWQVSADGSAWYNIPDATNATFTTPVDFMYNIAGITPLQMAKNPGGIACFSLDPKSPAVANYRELQFRSVFVNTNEVSNPFTIRFIRTNTSGYGVSPTGARYLTINRAANIADPISSTTIKMALLNLGATATDGRGLGGLYQWGRISDGHQIIDWTKNLPNPAKVMGPGASLSIANNRALSGVNTDPFGQATSPSFAGRFIVGDTGSNWSTGVVGISPTPPVGTSDLWGNGLGNTRAGSPVSLSDWTAKAQENNPCAALGVGWRVPSIYDWRDAAFCDGATNSASHTMIFWTTTSSSGNNNTWSWHFGQNGSAGGKIITNDLTNESLFLPAAQLRLGNEFVSFEMGEEGVYWQSTFGSMALITPFYTVVDYSLEIHIGASVRCVQ